MTDSVVANFGEDLKFSTTLSDEPDWLHYYRRLFPDLVAAVRVDVDSKMQRQGIDRILHLKNGAVYRVDEKKRRRSKKTGKLYNDLLLELYSDLDRQTPGWTIDEQKVCDFVAYALPPELQQCFFLPFPLLRMAFARHLESWRKQFGVRDVPNDFNGRQWVTRNIPVKWSVVRRALCEQMNRKYGGDLRLPQPKVIKEETDSGQLSLLFP
jgi:hypothetical protein